MSDTAAHLIDRVLPVVDYRQWVLSVPKRLRLALARDAVAARESARIFLREVFRWQRRQAKLLGIKKPHTGAVSITQRFGTKLDLNLHHHALLPDGVFTLDEKEIAGFKVLPPPTCEELQELVERIAAKTQAMARSRGLLDDEPCDALSRVQAESMQTSLPLPMLVEEEPVPVKLAGFFEGYSLEAGRQVDAKNREGLEQVLRYMLRPPVSNKRLRILPDGRVELKLKRPINGVEAIAMTGVQFLRKLAAIVPPPRLHSIRYFGVFAPSSKVRPKIVGTKGKNRRRKHKKNEVPEIPEVIDDGGAHDAQAAFEIGQGGAELEFNPLEFGLPPMPERQRTLDWAQLLRRVFKEDVLECPKCHGRRKVTAFIPESKRAREILEKLGLHDTAPPIAPARAPPRQVECFEPPPEYTGVDEQWPDQP